LPHPRSVAVRRRGTVRTRTQPLPAVEGGSLATGMAHDKAPLRRQPPDTLGPRPRSR
jgi:hypothetical protein